MEDIQSLRNFLSLNPFLLLGHKWDRALSTSAGSGAWKGYYNAVGGELGSKRKDKTTS